VPCYASDRYKEILHGLSKDYYITYTEDIHVVAKLRMPRKHIVLNRKYMDRLSDNEVAWVLSHEIGHTTTSMVRNYHEDEYRVDSMSLEMVRNSGYEFNRKDMVSIGNKIGMRMYEDTETHPAWSKRVNRMFPSEQRLIIENDRLVLK
jgi:hypothetical protein